MSADGQERPRARQDITVQDIGDEVMLHDSANEKIHVLNHSAYAIWELCNGENTLEDICAQMSTMYPSAGPDLIADIQATIEGLKERMLFI